MLNKVLKHLGFIVISNNKADRIRAELQHNITDLFCCERSIKLNDSTEMVEKNIKLNEEIQQQANDISHLIISLK